MDALTLMTLAHHQPKRAVRYGIGGVTEHAACAWAYYNRVALSDNVRNTNMASLILALAPLDGQRVCCFECTKDDLEYDDAT